MEQALIDRYRCPESLVKFDLSGSLSKEAGYFRFGQDTICYGRSATGFRASRADGVLYDALKDVTTNGSNPVLSFDPTEVIDNLRLERYANGDNQRALNRWKRSLRNAYYFLRPLHACQYSATFSAGPFEWLASLLFPHWPVDTTVEDLCERLLLLSMKAKRCGQGAFRLVLARWRSELCGHDARPRDGEREDLLL